MRDCAAVARQHSRPRGRGRSSTPAIGDDLPAIALGLQRTVGNRAVARLLAPRISRPGRALLQRANDKVALIAEPDPATPLSEAVAAVKAEIAAIYRRHRERKTAARAELDVTFRQLVHRLTERQDRLLAVALPRAIALAKSTLGLTLDQPPQPAADPTDQLLKAEDSVNVARAVIAALRPHHDDAVAARRELEGLENEIPEQIKRASEAARPGVRDLALKQLKGLVPGQQCISSGAWSDCRNSGGRRLRPANGRLHQRREGREGDQ